jgi:predicted transcriptional regulator
MSNNKHRETVARKIYEYLKEHKEATRPELELKLQLGEKAVDSALRKMTDIGAVKRDGVKKSPKRRPAAVFKLVKSFKNVDQLSWMPRHYTPKAQKEEVKPEETTVSLQSAMSLFFGKQEA